MSSRSIRAAVAEYLEVLAQDEIGQPRNYFQVLYDSRPGAMEAIVRNIEYGMRNFEPGPVLDIGCGHGLQAHVFAAHGYRVIGIDRMEDRLTSARTAAAKLGTDIRYLSGSALDHLCGLDVGSIWMHRSIAHMGGRSLSAIARALEPSGTLVFTISNTKGRRFIPSASQGQSDLGSMKALLATHGLDVVDHRYQGFASALPDRWVPKGAGRIDEALGRVPGLRSFGGNLAITARPV